MRNLAFVSSWKRLALIPAFALIASTQLSGCTGIPLPPIEVTISLVQNVQIQAAGQADGSFDVVVGAFCDLFNEEQLDMLLREAGGDVIADLVSIPRAELASVDVTATEGDFSTFTDASLTLTVVGGDPLPLGAAADSAGLGTSFALTQEMPVDLLNDLEDGQCGVPTMTVTGSVPVSDITLSATATVRVFTQVNL
jgi:hypothetical protein